MRRRTIRFLLLLSLPFLGVLFFWPRDRETGPASTHPLPGPHASKARFPHVVAKVPTGWRPFRPPDSYLLKPFVIEPTLAQRLPCIEQWASQGRPCEPTEQGRVDVVWTWVNGSEPILDTTRNEVIVAAMASVEGQRTPYFTGSRMTHFREHGELVNSMRSVWKSMPPGLVKKVRGRLALVTRNSDPYSTYY